MKALVGTMYLPKPVTFDSLWPHLHFQIPTDGHGNANRDATRTDYAQLLIRAVKAYLMGEGHPDHPALSEATGITPDQIHDERNDPHLRARLLLLAVLNKRQPPRQPSWKITVSRALTSPTERQSHAHASWASSTSATPQLVTKTTRQVLFSRTNSCLVSSLTLSSVSASDKGMLQTAPGDLWQVNGRSYPARELGRL